MSNIFPVAIDGIMLIFCNLTNAFLSYVTCFPITTLVYYLTFYFLLSSYILPLNKMFTTIAEDVASNNIRLTPNTTYRFHKAKHKHLYQEERRGRYPMHRLTTR